MSDEVSSVWKLFAQTGILAAVVGGIFGVLATRVLEDQVVTRAKNAALDAEKIVNSHNFDGWPLAIRCIDSRKTDQEKIYHLSSYNFLSGRVSDSETGQPMRVISYRHIWANPKHDTSSDLNKYQPTHDVEFSVKTQKIVWSNTAKGESLRNCYVGAGLDVVRTHYQRDAT